MKTTLTIEQSQRLIELGVDACKASMRMLYFPESDSSEPLESWQMWEGNGKLLCNPDESQVQDVECVIVPKSADYDLEAKEEHPIFTLADILSLLPRIIKYGNRVCRLKFQAIVSIHDGLSEVWQACYTHTSCKTNKEAPELIDALFELLCWILQNHSDKIKKLER